MTVHTNVTCTSDEDATIVAAQVGREPREPWRVAARCVHGRPSVILTPPELACGTPFWLTCPWLVDEIGRVESDGGVARSAAHLAADPELASRMKRADASYRSLRASLVPGDDPCASVGIAGMRDPLKTKCLHAHVAAFLGGIDDPVGEDVMSHLSSDCADDRCARYLVSPEKPEEIV
jgi:hypothetical protein